MVIPESERTIPLLINERVSIPNVFNFGKPVSASETGDTNGIGDEQSVVHNPGNIGHNVKVQVGWGYPVEIKGVAQEFPAVFQRRSKVDFSFQCINHYCHMCC